MSSSSDSDVSGGRTGDGDFLRFDLKLGLEDTLIGDADRSFAFLLERDDGPGNDSRSLSFLRPRGGPRREIEDNKFSSLSVAVGGGEGSADGASSGFCSGDFESDVCGTTSSVTADDSIDGGWADDEAGGAGTRNGAGGNDPKCQAPPGAIG
jgi:hypothetical protein